MYYMQINKNFVHQVGDQTKVILRCTVNQSSRLFHIFSVSIYLSFKGWNVWALEVVDPQEHRLTSVPEARNSMQQQTSFW